MTINILQSDESRTTSLYLQVFGKALKIRKHFLPLQRQYAIILLLSQKNIDIGEHKAMLQYINTNIILDWIMLIVIQTGIFLSGELIMYLRAKTLSEAGLYKPVNIFSIIGTPVHELGHLIFALIFFCKIQDVQLFPSKKKAVETGRSKVQLGHVTYSYNKRNPIQSSIGQIFIAMGPIFSGSLVICILAFFLERDLFLSIHTLINNSIASEQSLISYCMSNGADILGRIVPVLFPKSVYTVLFWLLVIAIAEHMNLSSADMKGYIKGAIVLTVLFVLLSFIPESVPYISNIVHKVLSFCTVVVSTIAFFTIIIQLCSLLIAFIISKILRMIKK